MGVQILTIFNFLEFKKLVLKKSGKLFLEKNAEF